MAFLNEVVIRCPNDKILMKNTSVFRHYIYERNTFVPVFIKNNNYEAIYKGTKVYIQDNYDENISDIKRCIEYSRFF